MESLTAFGDLGRRLGLLLHQADLSAMSGLAARLDIFDMTPVRATALVYVCLHEGGDQMALGRALGVNRARSMKVVDELEARGLVERRAGRDRRSNALHPTPAGAALKPRIEAAALAHEAAVFGGLTEAEQADLRRLLSKLSPDVRATAAAKTVSLFAAP